MYRECPFGEKMCEFDKRGKEEDREKKKKNEDNVRDTMGGAALFYPWFIGSAKTSSNFF